MIPFLFLVRCPDRDRVGISPDHSRRAAGIMLLLSTVFSIMFVAFLTPLQAYATNSNYLHRPTGLVFPQKLSYFLRGEARDYDLDNPGLGTGIPYNFVDINVMVNIYDKKISGLRIDSDALKRETKREVDVVYDKVKEGYYVNVELLEAPYIYSPGRGRPVYMAGFTVNVGSKTFREFIYMTSYKGHYVRIRITHPDSTSDDIVRNTFVRRLISMLAGTGPQGSGVGSAGQAPGPGR